MKRYKEEVDALHASDTLKAKIAALPQSAKPKKALPVKRIAVIAAALVVVLIAGFAATPALFSAQKSMDQMAIDDDFYAEAASKKPLGYSKEMPYLENAAEAEPADGFAYTTGMTPTDSTSAAPTLPSGRKLIRNADLDVQTKTFDAFHTAVMQKVEALGGYVESSSTGAFSTLRYENLKLRIPADSLDDFLSCVAELGTVTSQETSVQDVTDKYIDVKSRLAALETEQETLLALLKKAEKLTDILEIQDRLTEVRGSLESYKAQLQALDSQIDYSAVTMTVNEVERVTQPERKSFFQQLRQNLSDNLYSIGQGARDFALWFLSSLPYIALWLLGIGVVVLVAALVRRRIRKR